MRIAGRGLIDRNTPVGFRFDGKDYRSLSSIAKRITGTNWSGPRFFGLVSRSAAGAEAGEG